MDVNGVLIENAQVELEYVTLLFEFEEFNGVCTIVDSQWSYDWDEDSEVVSQYDWTMWLDMKYLGSTYSRMFGAHYNALDSTLTINTVA